MFNKSQNQRLDLTQPHDKIISSIFIELIQGNYQHWYTWYTLIKYHQGLDWSLNESSEKIKNILHKITQECELGVGQNHSGSITLLAGIYREGLGCTINYPRAVALYHHALKLNNPEAMIGLAYMHRHGLGVTHDYARSITLLDQAIEQKNPRALTWRAYMHNQGMGGEINHKQAIALYENAIKFGDKGAITCLADIYAKNIDDTKKYQKAIALFDKAIELGDPQAMCARADMHREGLGGDINYQEAIRLYEQAIALGNIRAIRIRAYMHRFGLNLDRVENYQEAFRLYEQGVRLNDIGSMCALAHMYRTNSVGTINYAKAIELYEKAIALGNPVAMCSRADMHREGQGGNKDLQKAIILYEMAIKRDNPVAMRALANIYRDNLHFDEAIQLYEKAIELGDAESMSLRGLMYENGYGSDKKVDLRAAARLYRKSAEHKSQLGENQLKNSEETIFRYHAYMLNAQFHEAIELILEDSAAFDEFMEFDLVQFSENWQTYSELAKHIIEVLSTYNSDTPSKKQKFMKVLLAIDKIEREQQNILSSEFKINYLAGIEFTVCTPEEFSLFAEMIVNIWLKEKEKNLLSIAKLLFKLFQPKELSELEQINYTTFIKPVTLVFLKAIYGDTIDLSESFQPTIDQLAFLASNFDNKIYFTPEILAEHVLKAPGALRSVEPHQKSNTPSASGFFSTPAYKNASQQIKPSNDSVDQLPNQKP